MRPPLFTLLVVVVTLYVHSEILRVFFKLKKKSLTRSLVENKIGIFRLEIIKKILLNKWEVFFYFPNFTKVFSMFV